MGQPKATHYQIFDHWKKKTLNDFLPNLQRIEPIIYDWGEPCCWACGKEAMPPKEEAAVQESCKIPGWGFDYARLWDSEKVISSLERCHIIPAALGGRDDASNLFLLCEECHKLSPDTTNPASFFRWVARRRKDYSNGHLSPEGIKTQINIELRDRGLPSFEEMASVLPQEEFTYEKVMEYGNEHLTSHFHSVAESSLICVFADLLEEKWREKTGASV